MLFSVNNCFVFTDKMTIYIHTHIYNTQHSTYSLTHTHTILTHTYTYTAEFAQTHPSHALPHSIEGALIDCSLTTERQVPMQEQEKAAV